MTDPEPQPTEDDEDNGEDGGEKGPEEKFGTSFWLVLALVGVLALLVIFLNVPGIRGATGLEMSKVNWSLESYADETGAMVPVRTDTPVRAMFDRGGMVTGNAGCNGYSAQYVIHETALNITQLIPRQMSCTGPGVMEQERQYLADIPRSASVRISSDRLRIFDRTGKPLLVYRAG